MIADAPGWARGLRAVMFKELPRQARRFGVLASLMQLAMLVPWWLTGAYVGEHVFTSWLAVGVVFVLWAPVLFTVDALHEEQEPARLEGLWLLSLTPVEVVGAKTLVAILLAGGLMLTAAPQLVMVALFSHMPAGTWAGALALVVAAIPGLAAFGVMVSGERLAFIRVAGWGVGLALGGLAMVLVGELYRTRHLQDLRWLLPLALVLAAAAFISATERFEGRPRVLLKRGLGVVTLGLWMAATRQEQAFVVATFTGMLFALDALTEPLCGALTGPRRALHHPLGATLYVVLLLTTAAAYRLVQGEPWVMSQVGVLGVALAISALVGQLLSRQVHPLISGAASWLGLTIAVELLDDDLLRPLEGWRGLPTEVILGLALIGGVVGLVLLKVRMAAWRRAQPGAWAPGADLSAGAQLGSPGADLTGAPAAALSAGAPAVGADAGATTLSAGVPALSAEAPAVGADAGAQLGAPAAGTPALGAPAAGALGPSGAAALSAGSSGAGLSAGALGLSDPLPERWPAALVKELMILLRGKLFLAVFGAGLLFQLLLFLSVAKGDLKGVIAPVELVAVFLCFTALSGERKDGKLDLLLFNQTPTRLVWGKWAAVALVQLMIFSLGLPALIAAYLLAHADLLTMLPLKIMSLALCWGGSAAVLWVSSNPSKLLSLGIMVSVSGVFLAVGSGLSLTLSTHTPSLVQWLIQLVSSVVQIIGFLDLAADQLSPLPSAQITARKRGLGLLLVGAAIGAAGLLEPRMEELVLLVLPAVFLAMDARWDPDEPAPRWALLAPGRRSALSYGLVVAAGVAAVAWMERNAVFGAVAFGQVLFWVLAPSLVQRSLRLHRQWLLPVVAVVGALQACSLLLADLTRGEIPNGVLLWPVLWEGRLSGDERVAWGIALAVGLAVVGSVHFALAGQRAAAGGGAAPQRAGAPP